eukprot:1161283-Pelagomonas_calceolata.AAC.3
MNRGILLIQLVKKSSCTCLRESVFGPLDMCTLFVVVGKHSKPPLFRQQPLHAFAWLPNTDFIPSLASCNITIDPEINAFSEILEPRLLQTKMSATHQIFGKALILR